MAKRMGRALLAALRKEPGASGGSKAGCLGHPQRRRALQYLCLDACGAIAEVRFTRVYPTRALEVRRDRMASRRKHFCDALLRRLEGEGESPEVLRQTATEVHLRFGRGAAKATLQLSIEPFSALLL